jgi:hypothetical protein
MKYFRLLFLLIIPFAARAQDTTVVKRQAALFAHATFRGDVKVIIAGKEQLAQLITERMDEQKKQGITGFEGSVGKPGKIYKAGDELLCLLPENIIMTTSVGRYRSRSYLLAVSDNNGESWTFLDVGKMPADILHRLLPNFNNELKIPPPVKAEFLAN